MDVEADDEFMDGMHAKKVPSIPIQFPPINPIHSIDISVSTSTLTSLPTLLENDDIRGTLRGSSILGSGDGDGDGGGNKRPEKHYEKY